MNDFYVYAYLDPRHPGEFKAGGLTCYKKPFYFGKGRGPRMYSHLRQAEQLLMNGENAEGKVGRKKLYKLLSMLADGVQPKIVKLKSDLTEQDALALEERLIRAFLPQGITNVRTTTWEPGERRGSGGKGGLRPGTKFRAGAKLYYDTRTKQHHAQSRDTMIKMIKAGLVRREDIKLVPKEKRARQDKKARDGATNGMHGKPSVNNGKHWYTVDGVDKMLFDVDAKKLSRKHKVAKGRSNLLDQCKTARTKGRRIIFEGELHSKYRTPKDIDANPRKKYQFGLIWKTEKPTYRNHKLLNFK